MSRKYYQVSRRRKGFSWFGWLIGFAILVGVVENIDKAVLIFAALGVGYAAYRYSNRQARLKTATLEKRLEDLKATIQLADRKVKLLDHYLAKEDFTQYAILAKQLLPQLSEIKKESGHLKEHMDISIYRRVTKKANDVESDVQLQLEKIQIAANLKAENLKEQAADPIYKAPELRHYYDNIQADHHSILEKIKGADNHEELLALHEANMRRFQDILQGYLKIKETPKNYYNADERLQQALEAIQQFDLDLDETLRKLNESELKDFDVSLRMMKGSAQASEANTTN